MIYRIENIKIKPGDDKAFLREKIAKKLRLETDDIKDVTIIRESVDARQRGNIMRVFTLDFSCSKKLKLKKGGRPVYSMPEKKQGFAERPVIIGFGPCGMFAGLILAQSGYAPVICERGRDVETRKKDVDRFWAEGYDNPSVFNPESNVQFGEGGAGTFSDGKLTTGIKDVRIEKVLQELVKAGAKREILYKYKPHLGTDALITIVKNIREKIIGLGGEVRFNTLVKDFKINKEGSLTGLLIESCEEDKIKKQNIMSCKTAVLAIGHSSRDTFKTCDEKGMKMCQKPFSVGVRVEHEQSFINKNQYGDANLSKFLGAADYKLSYRCRDGRGVYTFCMCPGGKIVLASSGKKQVLSNGMSGSLRNGEFANSAVLVEVKPQDFGSDYVLAGAKFQENIEKKAYELAGGYRLLTTDCKRFTKSELAECLPNFVVSDICEAMDVFNKKIKGFADVNPQMSGPETRSSSPVRFYRDKNFESNIKGVFPGGEGAGYAGGIMSAAVDGIKLAEAVIKELNKKNPAY